MSKPTLVVSCPIDTYSGYGARARDFVQSIIDLDKYDVKILSQRWGGTRFGYLKDHGNTSLISKIVPNLTQQPDIWVQITVPNEFQKVGKYNIGVTAGIETTLCDPTWIQGCNNMDLVLVSAQHAKKVFEESKFNMQDNQTGQITGTVELKTKVEVLFEGADIEKYTPLALPTTLDLSDIDEKFCFLTVGHWLPGILGEDRKNIGYTIKAFLETFKNKKDQPGLILKVQAGSGTSIMDREAVLDKIDAIRKTVKGKLPNIYLLHGDMSDAEVNELYNHTKVKAMISLTKGEGFGRPLLEFSLINKPIIASGWSGHIDFLDNQFTKQIGGTLTNVHPSAAVDKMILQESQWFRPDEGLTGKALKDVFEDYKIYKELAKRQGYRSRTEFSYDKMRETLDTFLTQYIPEFPKQVQLKLPQLKKIELPKLKKI
ncbi:RfaG Glycosyltransferase [uncultured Caudovirales phage]|uniref:RfaG Glycosyltransferase n=1 Tax=uncultured Caudovirales phage TaxID=2100421 RepID=A0A6J5KWC7_9CAUD|nr:RfaG Glycosyltransferase [uncultured Caudovirales phage]